MPPTPTTYPSAKKFVNYAKETDQGTAVTSAMTTMPLNTFDWKQEPVWLDDQALRGSMVKTYNKVQGVKKSSFNGAGPVFLDRLPHLLLNLMGELASTGPVSSIYTHLATLLNSGTAQPPSGTFAFYTGVTATSGARMIPGACLSELTLKGNPASTFLECSYKGLGWGVQPFPTAAPVNSPGTEVPAAAWRAELAFGGTLPGAKNVTVGAWEVTTTRELSAEFTSQNSQNPLIIQRGAITTKGKFTVLKPPDETFYTYFDTNAQPQFQLNISNGLAGANARTLTIDILAAAVDMADMTYNEEAIGYECTFEAIANTTNVGASGGYGTVAYTVTNAIASY